MLIRIVTWIICAVAYLIGTAASIGIRVITWAFGRPRALAQAFLQILNSSRVERYALEIGQVGVLQAMRMMIGQRVAEHDAPSGPVDLDATQEIPAAPPQEAEQVQISFYVTPQFKERLEECCEGASMEDLIDSALDSYYRELNQSAQPSGWFTFSPPHADLRTRVPVNVIGPPQTSPAPTSCDTGENSPVPPASR